MRVLVVGAGLIGTVYGAHLAAAGSTVSVPARRREAGRPAPSAHTANCPLSVW
ncbi:MAG: 2-dehydropantoate 2-reductase N-terminal domain-containing protein [Mycobacterium sp.]